MKRIVLLPVLAMVLAMGCGRPNSSTGGSTNATANSDNPIQAGSAYIGALGRAKQTAGKTVDIASLNQAIGLFQVDKGRFPKSLDELVQTGYLKQLPEVPYGMKLDYDPATGQAKVVSK